MDTDETLVEIHFAENPQTTEQQLLFTCDHCGVHFFRCGAQLTVVENEETKLFCSVTCQESFKVVPVSFKSAKYQAISEGENGVSQNLRDILQGTSVPFLGPKLPKNQICYNCNQQFSNLQHFVPTHEGSLCFCSQACLDTYQESAPMEYRCAQCTKHVSTDCDICVKNGKCQMFCPQKCQDLFKSCHQFQHMCSCCRNTGLWYELYEMFQKDCSFRFCSVCCIRKFEANCEELKSFCARCFSKTEVVCFAESSIESNEKAVHGFCSLHCLKSYLSQLHSKTSDWFFYTRTDMSNDMKSQAGIAVGAMSNPHGNEKNLVNKEINECTTMVDSDKSFEIESDQDDSDTTSEASIAVVRKSKGFKVKQKAKICKTRKPYTKAVIQKQISKKNKATQISSPPIALLPIPISVPCPVQMLPQTLVYPVPIPIPVPMPIFWPVTDSSPAGLNKVIRNIREKYPDDPIEAEMITFAENAHQVCDPGPETDEVASPEPETTHVKAFSSAPSNFVDQTIVDDDILSKMRCLRQVIPGNKFTYDIEKHDDDYGCVKQLKRARLELSFDKNFGLETWKLWVANIDPNKSCSSGDCDPLNLRISKLVCYLEKFVSTVNRPNGSAYKPDSVFYMLLGLQQHITSSGREDNIFNDAIYIHVQEELCKLFEQNIDQDGHYMHISKVTENHLWDCNQLGPCDPKVLLFTLMYFTTKAFQLYTAQDHYELSVSDIVKDKRSYYGKRTGLRYIKPSSKGGKELLLIENKNNSFRCPLLLFEFYLSKCPTVGALDCRNIFYLIPELSTSPDSPLWYTEKKLPLEDVQRLLSRCLMVYDIYRP